MTSSVSPAESDSPAHVENKPPGLFFTAIRSPPACTVEQIEYERRISCPSIVARNVTCWPASKRNCCASAGGISNVSATASRVSGSTAVSRNG
jgi:hypothetical protein